MGKQPGTRTRADKRNMQSLLEESGETHKGHAMTAPDERTDARLLPSVLRGDAEAVRLNAPQLSDVARDIEQAALRVVELESANAELRARIEAMEGLLKRVVGVFGRGAMRQNAVTLMLDSPVIEDIIDALKERK